MCLLQSRLPMVYHSPQLSAGNLAPNSLESQPHDCIAVGGAGSCDCHVTPPWCTAVDHNRRRTDTHWVGFEHQ